MEGKPQQHARARTTLEITVISGQNIGAAEEEVYVVVRAESLNCCTTKTAKNKGNDVDGGTNLLAWNERFMLDIPARARSVTFEVQSNKFKGARPIGVARIALSDFLGVSPQQSSCVQMLSYGLRDWEGRRNGVINFSVRVLVTTTTATKPEEGDSDSCVEKKPAAKGMASTVSPSGSFEAMGFKVDQKKINSCNHVVIGIPVCWNYPTTV